MVVKSSLKPLECYYNQVYSCLFSSDNKFVAAADHYGRVVLFELNYEDDLNTSTVKQCVQPCPVEEGETPSHVNTLASNDDMLFCGTSSGSIHAYRWSELTTGRTKSIVTQFDLPLIDGEVCAVATIDDDEDHIVCGGGGDNCMRLVNVETAQIVTKFAGHSKYIHAICVSNRDSNTAYSASEDGSVMIWDAARPKLGDWLGCVAVNDDWLVTGGGPALSLWNIKSQTHALTLPHDQKTEYLDVYMAKHTIVASGGRQKVAHFDYAGAMLGMTAIAVDHAVCINGTESCNDEDGLVVVSGYGNTVDILDTPLSRAASLHMP